jgi:hypothetical protein
MSDELRARLEKLIETVRAAKDKADAGESVDLSGLEKEVAALCRETATMGAAAAQELKPAIAEMISRLDELAASLVEYRKRLLQG